MKNYYRKLSSTLIESLGMKDGNMKVKYSGKYIKVIYSPIKLFQIYLTESKAFNSLVVFSIYVNVINTTIII